MTILSTYVLSAVSAALAGTILTSNVNSAKYNLGSGYTLAIITAVVLGGTLNTGGKGSILGTVLASLIICILRYGLPLCFDVSTQNLDLPVGIILVLVVLGPRDRRPGHDRQGDPHLQKVGRRLTKRISWDVVRRPLR